MARPRRTGEKTGTGKRRIEQDDHKGQQRKNNPPVGLVTEATDRDTSRKQYAYDPHLDPCPGADRRLLPPPSHPAPALFA